MAREHARAFSDIPTVSLAGIFSRTKSRAVDLAREFGIPKAYDSVEKLWKGTHADLVLIAVQEMATKEVCFEAFRYPWVALIEKPVGYNIKDATLILKEVESRRAQAFVALNRRHYSSTRAVISDIGKNDEPRIVNVFDQENPKVAKEKAEHFLVTKNWMYANSIHLVDFFPIFCRGQLKKITRIIPWKADNPSLVVAKLFYTSGDIGLYQAVWNRPGPWAVAVTTQSKRWELRPIEQAMIQVNASRNTEALPSHQWDFQFKPGLRLQAEEAINAVQGLSHRLPTLRDGFKTMQLINKIYHC